MKGPSGPFKFFDGLTIYSYIWSEVLIQLLLASTIFESGLNDDQEVEFNPVIIFNFHRSIFILIFITDTKRNSCL